MRGPASEVHEADALETLKDVAKVLASRPGVRTMAATAAGAWALRALLGKPRARDLAAAGAALAVWPLQEWAAHRYLLHLEPFRWRGRLIDPLFARTHRAHHEAPNDIDGTLLPREVVRAAIPSAAVVALVAFGPTRAALTAFATYSTMAVIYEWTHLLVHSAVKPKGRFYARVRRNHRLHHYRTEHYWFAFTVPHIDTLLGTDPEPASVPRSKTAYQAV